MLLELIPAICWQHLDENRDGRLAVVLLEKLVRASVICLDQPDLLVFQLLQRRYDVLLRLGPTRIQDLRLDIERPFAGHI